MKNIYDLLNQAEDNEDILSENERMEMTDIEKRCRRTSILRLLFPVSPM